MAEHGGHNAEHAEHGLPLLDDNPSNTPLDLLLNAISGSGGYAFPEPEAEGEGGDDVNAAPADGDAAISALLGEAEEHDEHDAGKYDGAESPRQAKVARTLRNHFAGIRGDAFSTIEVWHPKTGQKSYGKERRIIQPPPTLRVSGPLLPLLTHVTLSAYPNTDPEPTRPLLSAQSHRFALSEAPELLTYNEHSKKDERDRRARALRAQASKAGWGSTLPWERTRTGVRGRDELADGLTFPGLWVGEETGKMKEFRLELSVAQPGVEVDVNGEPLPDLVRMGVEASQPLDEAALRHVLGSTGMEPLMNLNQAEHEALPELLPAVLDSEVDAAVAAAEAHDDGQPETQLETQTQTQTPVDTHPSGHILPPAPAPWATFISDPLTIVSKPSQKTAKARSMASCLSTTDAFALFVRVNAQTVRTKLLKLEGAETDTPTLTARAGKWTPFRFEVVMRASLPEDEGKGARTRFKLDMDQENSIVTYGSIVRLVDVTSGVKSDCLRLVRVDKNEVTVGMDIGHPVSELQRIGLVRVTETLEDATPNGRRLYLSAPGALAGAGEVKTSRVRLPNRKSSSSVLPETLEGYEGESVPEPESLPSEPPRKKRKTKRHALARAVIDEEEQGASASGLLFKAAERRAGADGQGNPVIIEIVQDSMCWVLSSVGCFSYTFFNGLGEPGSLPAASLDPVPRLLVNPTINMTCTPATLQLTLSDFFVPDNLGVQQSLSVYLGPLGPLRATTWRSVAPKEKYFDPRSLYDAIPWSGVEEGPVQLTGKPLVRSNFPHSVPHVIVCVELPPVDEIVRAMHLAAESAEVPHNLEDPWLGVMGTAGELTIQEALHNAGKAAPTDAAGDHDMTAILSGAGEASESKVDNVEFELDHLGQPLIHPTATVQHSARESAAARTANAMLGESLGETEASTSASAPLRTGSPSAYETITMQRQVRTDAKDAAPLPLLLVRPDGVGNGIGWSLERVQSGQVEAGGHSGGSGAEHAEAGPGTEGEGIGLSDWGIRMVQTVARGQALSWSA